MRFVNYLLIYFTIFKVLQALWFHFLVLFFSERGCE